MNNKVENNQSDPEQCSFILLKFGYDNQFILPVEDALSMIRSLTGSTRYIDDYNKPTRIDTKISDITIGFLSQVDINKINVEAALQK
jgi:hypothetical protein